MEFMTTDVAKTPAAASTRFRDHPPGLKYLFFAELWERFSFYGIRAMLVFFITSEFLFTQDKAYGIYATYMALVYTTPILGGVIADRILGERKSIMLGGVLIALGHTCLTFTGQFIFYLGLALIISGTGLFKANISALLGKLYPHGDARRDSGFTLFHVGINIGSFFAPLTCGFIGEIYGWHYGFGLAAIGMLTGLVYFYRGLPSLGEHGEQPKEMIQGKTVVFGVGWEKLSYLLIFMSLPLVMLMVKHHEEFAYILPLAGVGALLYLLYLAFTMEGNERQNMLTFLVLLLFSVTFFALFEQAGSSMNFFAKLQVDRMLFGWEIPATAFQSLNPLFVIICGPLVAQLWIKLAARNMDPYTPFKFFMGLFPAALGFGVLALSTHFVNEHHLVSMWWLVLVYLLHTLGELCIYPVGLSMVTKLSPPKLTGTLMGIWFISLAFGNVFAGILSKLSSVNTNIEDASASLATYASAFASVAYIGFGVSLIMLLISPLLNGVFKREAQMKGYNE
jgi:proton-dependent oligopeptide transporter, POT family